MSTYRLLLLILIVLPVALYNWHFKLTLNKKMFYAIFRMILQLSVIGIVLNILFTKDLALINALYVLFMISVATYSMLKTTKLPIRTYGLSVWLAVLFPQMLVLLFFNAFIVNLEDVFEASHLIPVAGMLLGNSLSGNILAIGNFYDRIKSQEKQYYYNLSLCGNRLEALAPYFRSALLSSVNPTLASIETIGLVALPGMMTGQILGGANPTTAIKYQIAIMIAILVTRYFTAILAIKLTSNKAFDDYDRLIL